MIFITTYNNFCSFSNLVIFIINLVVMFVTISKNVGILFCY